MSQLLLSATALILAIVALRFAFGKWLGLRARYALWLLVVLRLLLPFSIGHSELSIENMFQQPRQAQPAVYVYEVPEVPGAEPVPVEQETPHQTSSPVNVLQILWLAGMGMTALWFTAVNVYSYHRVRKGARRLPLVGIPLRVYVSEGTDAPCQIGRSIFLPLQLAADEDRRRHILAHELTHFYHGDTLWNLLRAVLLCVYWFFPPVWLAAALSKKDCELACDEGALLRLGEAERFSYGRTLLSVASRNAKDRPVFSAETGMAQSKRELSARIKAITKKKSCPLGVTLLLVALLSLTVLCTFTGSALEAAEQTEPPAVQSPTELVLTVPNTLPPQPTLQAELAQIQSIPSEPQAAPTRLPATESATQAPKTDPKTEAQTQGGSASGKFYGTYTIKVGEQLAKTLYLEESVWVSVSDHTVVRADLFRTRELPANNYVFTATAYKVGTVEVYFSNLDERYLAFVIQVVANGEKEEIGYAEQEGETLSFVLPDFNIP